MNQTQIQNLLESTQEVFQTLHTVIVDEIIRRNGYFSAQGTGISADGQHFVCGIQDPDPAKELSYVTQVLKRFADQKGIMTAVICFSQKTPMESSSELIDTIVILLEDNQKTAIECRGTYRRVANTWEFGDMTAKVGKPILFN